MYYGAFGSHTAMVIRRLRRLCQHYGADPVFIVASATIANPQHHAQVLIGVPHVHLVDEDGSPHGPKTFVMWNPPLSRPNIAGSESEQPVAKDVIVDMRLVSADLDSNPPLSRSSAERRSSGKALCPSSDLRGTGRSSIPGASESHGRELRSSSAAIEVGPKVSEAELLLAKEALASVQVQGSASLSDSMPKLGAGARSDVSCVLLTSKGRRNLGALDGGKRLLELRREADQRMPTPSEWKQRLKEQIAAKQDEDSPNKRRVSPIVEVAMLLSECIRFGLRTIAFCKSRKLCELVATYVHERLQCCPGLAKTFKVREAPSYNFFLSKRRL